MYHARFLERVLSGPVSRHKVRLLFGARQTGKTQLLLHLLARRETRFFDLQALGRAAAFRGRPRGVRT